MAKLRIPFSNLWAALLGYLYPLVFGIALGWLCALLVGFALASNNPESKFSKTFAGLDPLQKKEQADDGFSGFLFANPFSVTPMPSAVAEKVESGDEVVITGSLASAVLAGTFPDFGAWLEDKEKLKKVIFLSIGETFDSYKLTSVLYDRAIFEGDDGNSVTKFLYLLPDAAAKAPAPTQRPDRKPPTGDLAGQVTAAVAGGKEGVVARDVVNRLLMNPFEEMNKFRLRPKFEGEQSVGISVEWIQEDSILGSLGVTEKDVIKSVNGIAIKNMGDVANAINSLMNGTRFDVEVLRDGAQTMLTYVVK